MAVGNNRNIFGITIRLTQTIEALNEKKFEPIAIYVNNQKLILEITELIILHREPKKIRSKQYFE